VGLSEPAEILSDETIINKDKKSIFIYDGFKENI
jgi:hypothetical protein